MTSSSMMPSDQDSIPKLLARNATQIGSNAAYREKEFGIWQSWSRAETHEEITALAIGMMRLGLAPGDHLAIIGRNRPYFYWAMVAAQCVGAVPVPIYQDSVAEEMAYVLDHCSARFVVAEDQEQVDKVLEIQDRLETLEHLIFLDPRGLSKYDRTHLHDYREVQADGRAHLAEHKDQLAARIAAQTGDDTCVMLYTSGTTGRPKGVVLSNINIISTAKAACDFDNLRADDIVLAYLPMAWVGDFIFSIGK